MQTPSNQTETIALTTVREQHWRSEKAKTTCPYCGVGCGVSIQCDSKKVIDNTGGVTHTVDMSELAGDAEHPANFGKLCVKGSHLLDTTDNSDKLLYPHIHGQRASWDEALDTMAKHIQSCVSEYGPDSVAFYLSGQLLTEDYYIANKLMKGFIGTANVDTNSRLCMSSAVAGYKRAFGADAVPCCYEDLEHTDLLVLVGSNAAWTHPVLFQRMQASLAANPARKMVVIDPRKTATSDSADLHLAIKPGTDAWVYNGLLNYLINQQLCDYAYIQQHTNNFEACSEGVKTYTTASVARITGVAEHTIIQFYKMFASAHSAISFYSMGVNQSTTGVDKTNSIINCHLASGKIGKVGSGPFSITGQPNAMGGREVGGLANMLAAHMDIENKAHNALVEKFWCAPNMAQKNGLKAVDMFAKMAAGDIKFIWIMGTNPVVSMPNRLEVEAALEKCEMVVVSDIVTRNDTLAFADIALPATGWSEKDGTVTNSERRISRQRGIMPIQGECKHDWLIINELAAKLGFESAFNYQHPAQIFDEHARLSAFENSGQRDFDLSAMTGLSETEYNQLKPIQWPVNSAAPKGTKRLFEDGKFYTANQKANFVTVSAALPTQQTSSAFPFVLNTGRMRDQWHTMTRTGKAKALVEHSQQAEIHIHPVDAKAANVQNGHLICLTSKANTDKGVIAPVTISSSVKPGELFVPIHWSKTNSSHVDLTTLFTSANDPISGQPELKHAAVHVEKVTPVASIILAIKKSALVENTQLAEYQVSINQGDFCLLHLAELNWTGKQTASENTHITATRALIDKVMQQLGSQITWLAKDSPSQSLNARLGFSGTSLIAQVIYATSNSDVNLLSKFNSDFMQECFNETELSGTNQHHLLSASSPSEFQQGKLICSCFKVRKNTIEAAIKEGANTVSKLGDILKCGTNCGSCKSELASLIKYSEATAQPSRSTTELADQKLVTMELSK